MGGDPRDALERLLDAILEYGSYVDLDRCSEGEGPVASAYKALGKPLPDEVRNWLQIAPGRSSTGA